MLKFVLKNIESIKGRQMFYQLVILNENSKYDKNQSEDELKGQFDLYEDSLEESYECALASILGIMDRVANLNTVSKEKFKDITPSGDKTKEYEFKPGDLRVYGIKIPNGKLIILGGFKNKQKADIKKFRSLKKEYLQSINSTQ